MSRASKIFLGASLAFMGGTIWGVHYLQQRESDTMYLGVLRDEERVRAKAAAKAGAVLQPDAVVDPDCATCVISPPPQLLEAQSAAERARERAARASEYEAQKDLAARLVKEQSNERLV